MGKYKISPNVVSRELQGEQVILDMASGMYFGLNETGSVAWSLIQESKDPSEIEDVISRKFENADPTVVGPELEVLFAKLLAKGLITVE